MESLQKIIVVAGIFFHFLYEGNRQFAKWINALSDVILSCSQQVLLSGTLALNLNASHPPSSPPTYTYYYRHYISSPQSLSETLPPPTHPTKEDMANWNVFYKGLGGLYFILACESNKNIEKFENILKSMWQNCLTLLFCNYISVARRRLLGWLWRLQPEPFFLLFVFEVRLTLRGGGGRRQQRLARLPVRLAGTLG